MKETGIVESVETHEVTVRIEKDTSCHGCSLCKGPGGLLHLVEEDRRLVPGQRVMIEIPGWAIVASAGILFLLPILAMTAGAVLGAHIGSRTGSRDTAALTGCVRELFLGLCALPIFDRILRRMQKARPRIIEIGKGEGEEEARIGQGEGHV